MRRRGFTLIELVAVIVVLAILGGVALPRLVSQASRAKDSADAAALAGINTALHGAYMSHRATDADASVWVTTPGAINAHMETGRLPEGWTVDADQILDQRGNAYTLEIETAEAPARLVLVGAPGSGGTVAQGGGSGSGVASEGGSSGGSSGGGTRSTADVRALTAAQIPSANLTEDEFALLLPEQLAALDPADLAAFGGAYISRLSGAQVQALTFAQFEAVASFVTVAQVPLARADQIAMLSAVAYAALTPDQRAAMTDAQRAERTISEHARALPSSGIRALAVAAIKYLLPSQLAGIRNDYEMSLISADRRAAFTQDQVRALNARDVSIGYLTDAQRLQLTTAQMAAIRTDDVRHAPVARLGDIPPATIGAIANDYAMSLISADRRAAFSAAQVQALNARNVSIGYLTEAQRSQLTTAQMAAIRTDDVRHAPVARLGDIPPATIGAIANDYAMSLISADRRAAFSAAQVQALNTAAVSLSYLTESQRSSATVAQIAAVRHTDVRYVPASRIGEVPVATIGAISGGYAWSLVPTAQVQALTRDQVVGISADNYSAIASRLTPEQRSWR